MMIEVFPLRQIASEIANNSSKRSRARSSPLCVLFAGQFAAIDTFKATASKLHSATSQLCELDSMSIFAKLVITIAAFVLHILGYAALQETMYGGTFNPRGSTIIATFIPAIIATWTANVRLPFRFLSWAVRLAVASLIVWIADITAIERLLWLNKMFHGSIWLSVATLHAILPTTMAAVGGWFLTRRILRQGSSEARI